MSLELTSPSFGQGGRIPARHTCAGEDRSPELHWTGVPSGTASFALIMEDPDAPAGTWVHWVLWGLAPATRLLPAGLPPLKKLAGGVHQGPCGGVDRFPALGYQGPCPPSGTHHYRFNLYALDRVLTLPEDADVFRLRAAMQGHILAEACLMGLFSR
jgi:Raf kinase inhibitor-like YbhB/YbcL family protein